MSAEKSWFHFLGGNAFQVDAEEAEASIREKYPLLLHKDERIELAFKSRGGLGRDKSYCTSHRILIKDGKGIGSKRKNYLSIPYYSIQAFSVETAGAFDGDMDLKVYSTGVDYVKMDFAKGQVNIFVIQQYLNGKVNWTKAEQGTQDYVRGEPSSVQSSSPISEVVNWLGNNAAQLVPSVVEEQFKTKFPVLLKDEVVEMAFRAGRDYTILTDKRFLHVNVQGLTGKRVEFKSFPWKTFSGFSVQTAGALFDIDTEINLFTNLVKHGKVKQDFRKQHADLFAIQMHLSNKILGADKDVLPDVDQKQGHVDPKTSWWFKDNHRPLDAVEMNRYYHDSIPLLQSSEKVEMAFKGRRDITLFTTKRVIDIDPKGFSGAMVEYTSVPWESIVSFGVKTAGKTLDRDCEVMLYTDMMFEPNDDKEDEGPEPYMSYWELDFNKDLVNVVAMKKYLSSRCLVQAANVPVPQNVFMISATQGAFEKFLSTLGADQHAIDPTELNRVLHTTQPVLLDDETIIMAFKAGRDITLFTKLRIMVLDVQGWSGEKIEYTSIPYTSIRAFAAESAGGWDRDSEIDIYTRNLWTMKKMKLDFRKGKADIISIQKFLAAIVLGSTEDAGKYLDSQEPITQTTNAAGMQSFLSWVNNNSVEEGVSVADQQLHSDPKILLDDEHVEKVFRQGRDMYIYTTDRMLLVDVQGFSGKKVEYKSIPWKWCQGFECETAGNLDRDAELYLHCDIPKLTRVKQSILVKDFDIYELQQLAYGKIIDTAAATK